MFRSLKLYTASLLISTFACLQAGASCVNYRDSAYAHHDIDASGEDINGAATDFDGDRLKSFFAVWQRHAIEGSVGINRNPIVHLQLGYEAADAELYLFALLSLEHASINLNRTVLCEAPLLHFLIFAGRRHALLEHFRETETAFAETYGNLTGGVNFPIDWLPDLDFHRSKCVVFLLSAENLASFSRSTAAPCF